MEFDEHEEQDEEEAIPIRVNYQSVGNSASITGRDKILGAGEGLSTEVSKRGGDDSNGGRATSHRYRECMKNHAVGLGGHAVDGCLEFMPSGEEGTLDALRCAACNCHRNFHRKESESESFHQTHHQFSTYYHFTPQTSGYFHVTPSLHYQTPLALPSNSREDEDMSNPSSTGGGTGATKKRFRTKFTAEQKEKMLAFAEKLEWRIQKHDEAAVQQFCEETNVRRRVLKVWMHNNKHTLGKRP